MARGGDRGGDDGLEDFFAAARAARPQPTEALATRVLADAAATARPRPSPPRRRLLRGWESLTATFGGSGVVAGLCSAALAGLWVGLAQPAPLAALGDRLWPQAALEDVDLFPDFEEVLSDAEG